MAVATTDDGVDLYYEETGSGVPVIFVHEFAGDMRSWEPQVRHFARWYRCVTFNARGYPPSGVPTQEGAYSQDRAVADIVAVMDALCIERAHVVGLSMGGFAALHFGLQHPGRAFSLCVAGVGYGAEPELQETFRRESEVSAAFLKDQGMQAFANKYSVGPTRLSFKRADPRGFAEFSAQLAQHSALGSANTQLGVQRKRPSLYSLRESLARLTIPTLIMNGDEDWPCLAAGLMLKSSIPAAAMSIVPNCGHTINLETPDEFNRIVGAFLAQASSGRWPVSEGLSAGGSITGMLDSRA